LGEGGEGAGGGDGVRSDEAVEGGGGHCFQVHTQRENDEEDEENDEIGMMMRRRVE